MAFDVSPDDSAGPWAILRAGPRIAAYIVFGAAFDMALDALPEGWTLWVGQGADGYTARADPRREGKTGRSERRHGPTPAEALISLATTLERQRS